MDLDRDYIKAQRLLIEKARASGDEQELAVGLYELGKYFEGRSGRFDAVREGFRTV